MRVFRRLLLVALVGAVVAFAVQPVQRDTQEPRPARSVQLVKVLDGDTFIARLSDGSEHSVRILGIDAPELAHDGASTQCGAREAAYQLTALLSTSTDIVLVPDPQSDSQDRFGRLLRYVATQHTPDVGHVLVAQGFVGAWYPPREVQPMRYPAYRTAERAAKADHRGSWATCAQLGR